MALLTLHLERADTKAGLDRLAVDLVFPTVTGRVRGRPTPPVT